MDSEDSTQQRAAANMRAPGAMFSEASEMNVRLREEAIMAIPSRELIARDIEDQIDILVDRPGRKMTLLFLATDGTAFSLTMPTALARTLQADIARTLRAPSPDDPPPKT